MFDANTRAPLARVLREHEVVRADSLGWQGLENGMSLDAAEHKLALFILSSNHWPTLRPIAARIAISVDFVQSGQIVEFDITAP